MFCHLTQQRAHSRKLTVFGESTDTSPLIVYLFTHREQPIRHATPRLEGNHDDSHQHTIGEAAGPAAARHYLPAFRTLFDHTSPVALSALFVFLT